jgi:hypothetical protein
MSAWTLVRSIGLCVAGAALVLGCEAEADSSGYGSGGSGSSSGGCSASTPSPQPLLVDVDPNQTMSANPGDGVGVFVEYKSGGHWHVWWTCDSNKTGQTCSFDNTVTVATGTITNLVSQGFADSDTVQQPSTQKVEAVTTTSYAVDGITFDTPFSAGQTPIIELYAVLPCVSGGQYLFFVQKGQINGGYQGVLTDPLMLEPSGP